MKKLFAFSTLFLLFSSCSIIQKKKNDDQSSIQHVHILCTDGAYNQPLANCQLLINGEVVAISGEDGFLTFDTVCKSSTFSYNVICTDELHINDCPTTFYDHKLDVKHYIFYPSEKYENLIWAREDSIFGVVSKAKMESVSPKIEKEIIPALPGDSEAEFPGGDEMMKKYINDNIKYPDCAMEMNISGRVLVKFMIQKNGQISHITAQIGTDEIINREAIRVIRNFPTWIPSEKDYESVKTKVLIPIIFQLL